MTIFEATMIVEGQDESADYDTHVEAWQLLIDTGACWKLQGWFRRSAHQLIEDGVCHA